MTIEELKEDERSIWNELLEKADAIAEELNWTNPEMLRQSVQMSEIPKNPLCKQLSSPLSELKLDREMSPLLWVWGGNDTSPIQKRDSHLHPFMHSRIIWNLKWENEKS
jgi:hypothetical protein